MEQRRCCGCYDLKRGSLAIGITLLVLYIVTAVIQLALVLAFPLGPPRDADEGGTGATTATVAVIILIVLAIHVTFNSLLVLGARYGRAGILLAWLVYHGIACGLQTMGLLVSFVMAALHGPGWLLVVVLIAVGLMAVFWYWLAVVLFFLREVREHTGVVYGQQLDEHGTEE